MKTLRVFIAAKDDGANAQADESLDLEAICKMWLKKLKSHYSIEICFKQKFTNNV